MGYGAQKTFIIHYYESVLNNKVTIFYEIRGSYHLCVSSTFAGYSLSNVVTSTHQHAYQCFKTE